MNEESTAATAERPTGWIVQCPRCLHWWKVSRQDVEQGHKTVCCPTCVDKRAKGALV